MEIQKEIISKIERDYFFIEGQLDVKNPQYFINKIEEGIKKDDNLNHQTNVRGHHTAWNCFSFDKEFHILLFKLLNYIDTLENSLTITKQHFRLSEAWGVREGFGEYSQKHHHLPAFFSGTIYLNDHPQKLFFPELNRTITPTCGKFVLFSSFFLHYTNRNLTDKYKYAIPFNFKYRTVDDMPVK